LIYNQALSMVRIVGNVGEVLHRAEAQSAGMRKWSGIERTVRAAVSLGRAAAAVGVTASLAMIAGCGNTYRPVVSAIGEVGPAAQPTKYAVAISSPTQVPSSSPITFVGAWSPTTTYTINQGVSYQGSQYVSLHNANVGQTPSTATAYWSLLANGLVTMVDFSGDTVMVTATIGLDPYYMALNFGGNTAYTLNNDRTMTTFGITPFLISSQVQQTTLLAGTNPVSVTANQYSTFIPDPGVSAVDQLYGAPPALKQELPVASAYTPVFVVGQSSSSRYYAINAATSGGPGQVSGNRERKQRKQYRRPFRPYFRWVAGRYMGLMTVRQPARLHPEPDGWDGVGDQRADQRSWIRRSARLRWVPVLCGRTLASGLDELVVANEGTGTTQWLGDDRQHSRCVRRRRCRLNPNCDPANPIDATTFGQVVATIPVGVNPVMVSVLSDYSRAYVANAGNSQPALRHRNRGVRVRLSCSVSVVNLSTNTVTATIPINGHPAYIATTDSTPTG
jgi:YVTN family beta-propeller protein